MRAVVALPRAVLRGRRRLGCVLVVMAGVGVVTPGRAIADGLRRLDAAWLLPPRFEWVAVTAAAAEPACGPWVRLGQARLHGLPELPVRAIAVGGAARGGAGGGEIAWETLGTGALRDDRLCLRVALGRRLRWGLGARWRRLQAGAGEPGLRSDVALEAGWRAWNGAGDGWALEARWPLLAGGDAWLGGEPETRLRAVAGTRGRAIAVVLDVAPSGEATAGWEALCGLGGGCGFAWRVDGASGANGGGLVCWRGRFRLRTSHLAHPVLGLTHRLEVSVGRLAGAPW